MRARRYQWYKRENGVRYLPESMQASTRPEPSGSSPGAQLWKGKRKTGEDLNSLEERLEETLILHCLGLFRKSRMNLKTTNSIEPLIALIGQKTNKVDYWKRTVIRSIGDQLVPFWTLSGGSKR